MFFFADILRLIALALITNSHLDGVYPIDISWGGAPGLCLFFVLSGFLLTGVQRDKCFGIWYIRHIMRLLVSTTIVITAGILIDYTHVNGVFGFLNMYPNSNYWFGFCIAVLYIPYYFIVKYRPQWILPAIGITLTAYFAVYYLCFDITEWFVEPYWFFKYCYGFICMLIGARIRLKLPENRGGGTLYVLLSCIGIVGFLGTKLLLNRFELVMRMQFLTQVFSVLFAVNLLLLGIKTENWFKNSADSRWYRVLSKLSKCTYEIYLVQFATIHYLKGFVFPLNIIMIIATTVITGMIVAAVSRGISGKICNLLRAEN